MGIVQIALVAHHLVIEPIDILRCEEVQPPVAVEHLGQDVCKCALPLTLTQPNDETSAQLVIGQRIDFEIAVCQCGTNVVCELLFLPLD